MGKHLSKRTALRWSSISLVLETVNVHIPTAFSQTPEQEFTWPGYSCRILVGQISVWHHTLENRFYIFTCLAKKLHSPSFISWFSSLFSEWCLRLWASCHTLAPRDGPLIFSKLKNPLLDTIKLGESEKGCLPSDNKYCEAVGDGLSFNPSLEISVGKQRSVRIKLAPAWEHD